MFCRVRRKLLSSGDLDGKDFLRLFFVFDLFNIDVWVFFLGVRFFDVVFVILFKLIIIDFVFGLFLFLFFLFLVFCFFVDFVWLVIFGDIFLVFFGFFLVL